MAFSPPTGVTFHTTLNVPVAVLATVLRRAVCFLQGLEVSSPPLRLYHDWWQHDGLHFDRQSITFHDLFSMIDTPCAIFEATPDDHDVFVGIAPEGNLWYLRFRADWDADDQSIIGGFAITVPSYLASAFRNEVASSPELVLFEEESGIYYKRVMA